MSLGPKVLREVEVIAIAIENGLCYAKIENVPVETLAVWEDSRLSEINARALLNLADRHAALLDRIGGVLC